VGIVNGPGDGELPFGDDDTPEPPAGPPAARDDGLRNRQDPVEGARLRDEAIEQVGHRPETITLLDAVHATACRMAHFTADDVWATYETPVDEGRSLGAAFRSAQRVGWIVPTDRYIQSVRPEAHRGPKRVWRSTIASD
jgi:hypothetical protein